MDVAAVGAQTLRPCLTPVRATSAARTPHAAAGFSAVTRWPAGVWPAPSADYLPIVSARPLLEARPSGVASDSDTPCIASEEPLRLSAEGIGRAKVLMPPTTGPAPNRPRSNDV